MEDVHPTRSKVRKPTGIFEPSLKGWTAGSSDNKEEFCPPRSTRRRQLRNQNILTFWPLREIVGVMVVPNFLNVVQVMLNGKRRRNPKGVEP